MKDPIKEKVVIVGAGPAGLSAALELSRHNYEVLILDSDHAVGGISKTINYKGNLFDIGPHRFFTKNEEVLKIWRQALGKDFRKVPRLTRIYYNKKFFKYPIELADTLKNAGVLTSIACLLSFVRYRLLPIRPEKSFSDWTTNRFGKKLFLMFFKSYTEKVWGISTDELSAEWAAQRIKGLSLWEAVRNSVSKSKNKAKSLIDEFDYPKYGAGMMYEAIAKQIQANKGKILYEHKVIALKTARGKVTEVIAETKKGKVSFAADHFISTAPLPETLEYLGSAVSNTDKINKHLKFRNFTSVNFVLNHDNIFPDNWIYIHDPKVVLGRIPNFKNFSIDMLKDKKQTLIGCEYFCYETDFAWKESDEKVIAFAAEELEAMGLIEKKWIADAFVERVKNAYPLYAGKYQKSIEEARAALAKFSNLHVAGRGGMFRYNNMDHSVLAGLYSARKIMGEEVDVWEVNAEDEYHEVKK